MTQKQELAYQRKAKLRKKHRKVRAALVSDMTNLRTAVRKSRKGKEGKKGVVIFDKDPEGNLLRLQQSLTDGTYHTSEGHDCMRRCPCGKIRKLHKLPYYPDHIEQHALMQILMPYLVKALYIESGASVKGRGMMYAKQRTERWIDENKSCGRLYYCKLDFVGYRFYFNHTLLRKRMKQKFKRKMHNLVNPMRRYQVAMSYKGWLIHCNGINLWRKVTHMDSFDDFTMPKFEDRDAEGKRILQGRKGTVAMILNQPMTLQDVEFDVRSQFGKTGLTNIMQVQLGGVTYKLRTSNSYLVKQLKWFQENGHLPLRGWKFINWNLSGIGNPDYRIVRPDWTPEEGF